jgi:beta-N-acetylhexosaminidase
MPRAAIVSCSGPSLTPEERRFVRSADPLGLIVFARNITDRSQLASLTSSFRDEVGREDAPILIDQEGGRVARLRPPQWRATEPAESYAALYGRNPAAALEAVRLNAGLMAAELLEVGITVDCAPDCDLSFPEADRQVVGSRSFGAAPAQVIALARSVAEGLLDRGVLSVIKHMPGHGRAKVDSHKALPRVDTDRATLRATDFAVFRALADLPWGMTGHLLFSAIDPDRPATQSPTIIRDVIRGEFGFDGFLVTDDLCMGALDGDMGERVARAIEAGCDAALICDGDLERTRAGVERAPELAGRALERYLAGEARRVGARREGFDVAAAQARHDMLLGLGRAA